MAAEECGTVFPTSTHHISRTCYVHVSDKVIKTAIMLHNVHIRRSTATDDLVAWSVCHVADCSAVWDGACADCITWGSDPHTVTGPVNGGKYCLLRTIEMPLLECNVAVAELLWILFWYSYSHGK